VGERFAAYPVCTKTITALSVKNLNETIVGSWLLWVAGAAAKLLPIIQFLSFTAALVLSCIGIYKFFKNGKK
jgi:hypothetical protein